MNVNACRSIFVAVSTSFLVLMPSYGWAAPKDLPWSAEVEEALEKAGKNRAELEKALTDAPSDQRKGMAFLIADMPANDLRSLNSDFLLENLALAYRAKKQTSWGKDMPEEIFLNNVLPYANVDETRDPWRKDLYDLCFPFVKDCKTASEAVQVLNSKLFEKLKVKYSTQRKKAQQSPKESIEQGMASCTGLSILLSDACRSVGIAARIVGTPLWANQRGNHTWLEIWDGRWRFTGACEPDPQGLDRGWFVGDAAQAKKDVPEHAIYAASFRRTKTIFPLVWDRDRKDVFAENVTDRYARAESPRADRVRVSIRVRSAGAKKRIALPVIAADSEQPETVFTGESRGESADLNDLLTFELLPDREYRLRIGKPVRLEKLLKTDRAELQTWDVEVSLEEKKQPSDKEDLAPDRLQPIEKEAGRFFNASMEQQGQWSFDPIFDRVLLEHESAVRAVVWKAYRSLASHEKLRKDFEGQQVRFKEHLSPYRVHEVGKRPKSGWPLVIALHGGGGVAKAVNDDQWKMMQMYYKDQPSVEGYKYLALRAPNDTWNGFYDDYVPPLIERLIRQFALFGDIDTNKVFLMGYSHGGYGAFFIGPKIPDRFAAVHCSASAPTDGTIAPGNLRNTRFTVMIGERDTAFGRRERCEKFDAEVQKLRAENKGDYPVEVELMKGFGHGGLPDRDEIKKLYDYTRNPAPRRVTWELTDSLIGDFFWLSVSRPQKGAQFDAKIQGNRIDITTRNATDLDLNLDGRLIEFNKPLKVLLDGTTREMEVRPSVATLCRSLLRRGDIELASTCQVHLELPKK